MKSQSCALWSAKMWCCLRPVTTGCHPCHRAVPPKCLKMTQPSRSSKRRSMNISIKRLVLRNVSMSWSKSKKPQSLRLWIRTMRLQRCRASHRSINWPVSTLNLAPRRPLKRLSPRKSKALSRPSKFTWIRLANLIRRFSSFHRRLRS